MSHAQARISSAPGARGFVIAIDGPAGAGKSTIARAVAEALGYTLLDTGALYRAIAFVAQREGVALEDEAAVGALTEALVARDGLRIEPLGGAGMRVRIEGVDPGDALRTPAVSMGASVVSAQPRVRAALLDLQRAFGASGQGVVCEGRDIGTVVFPDAPLKIFLTASVEARAQRRFRELAEKGGAVDLEQTRREVAQRDAQDENRAIAPLRRAPDARLVDTTALGLDGAVDEVLSLCRAMIASRAASA
jgi:cytidylate kinase